MIIDNIEYKLMELYNYKKLFEKYNFNFSTQQNIHLNSLIDEYINRYKNTPCFKNFIETKFIIYDIIFENYGFYNYFRDDNNYYLCFDSENYKFISDKIYDSMKTFENYKIHNLDLFCIKLIFIEKQKGYLTDGVHLKITINNNLIFEESVRYLYLNIIQDKIFETVITLL